MGAVIKRHVESQTHVAAVAAAAVARPTGPIQLTLPQTLALPAARQIVDEADKRKVMQFTLCLHSLQGGRAATAVEKDKALFEQLVKEGYMSKEYGVTASHWGDDAVWEMISSLSAVERRYAMADITKALVFSLSLDESTAVDKTALMSLHLYIIDRRTWQRRHIFVKLADVTGGNEGVEDKEEDWGGRTGGVGRGMHPANPKILKRITGSYPPIPRAQAGCSLTSWRECHLRTHRRLSWQPLVETDVEARSQGWGWKPHLSCHPSQLCSKAHPWPRQV